MKVNKSLTVEVPHDKVDDFKTMIKKVCKQHSSVGLNVSELSATELEILKDLNDQLK